MKQRVTIQCYGVPFDVLLEIDLQRLADRLGAKAAESRGCKSTLAQGDITATVSRATREKVLASRAARRARLRDTFQPAPRTPIFAPAVGDSHSCANCGHLHQEHELMIATGNRACPG